MPPRRPALSQQNDGLLRRHVPDDQKDEALKRYPVIGLSDWRGLIQRRSFVVHPKQQSDGPSMRVCVVDWIQQIGR
jgi:hypothetical protein